MSLATVKNVIIKVAQFALPFLKKMAEDKIIPLAISKMYEFFDAQSNYIIDKLFELLEKIRTTENPIKKAAHIKGFKLGLAIVEAVGKKLTESAEVLNRAIVEVEAK